MAGEVLGAAGEGLAAQFDSAPADVAALYDNWVKNSYDADLAAWGYDAHVRAARHVVVVVAGAGVVAGTGVGRCGA